MCRGIRIFMAILCALRVRSPKALLWEAAWSEKQSPVCRFERYDATERVRGGVLGITESTRRNNETPIFDENSTGREKRPSKNSKIGGSPDADPLQRAAEGVKESQKVGCGPIKRRIRIFLQNH
nr:MAG TPA: hypothetical protein [Caudoviricetes sp.]